MQLHHMTVASVPVAARATASAVCAFEPLAGTRPTACTRSTWANGVANELKSNNNICAERPANISTMTYDEEEGNFWSSVNKLSRNPDRPKRNSKFLIFLFLVGCVGVVVFSVLAVLTLNSRNPSGCPCANPYKILGNGEKLLDPEQCFKDMTYMACWDKKTHQHMVYSGLAAGSGGLLVIALLLFRYG